MLVEMTARTVYEGALFMRSMEMLSAFINIVLLGWLILARTKSRRAMLIGLAISAIAVLFHGIMEGMRWQMVPIYLITIIPIVILGVQSIFEPKERTGKGSRIRRILALSLAFLYGIIAVALPIVLPVFTFEKPAGPYSIGTVTYDWIDEQREETFTAEAGDKRELMVQIWYPAELQASGTREHYLSDAGPFAEGYSKLLNMPKALFTTFEHVRTHAVEDAAIATREPAYPVLLFSHGFSGHKNQNTFQIEQLVSEGYIVVGIDHTYSSMASVFADGRVAWLVPQDTDSADYLDQANEGWVEDVKFVLHQLEQLANHDPEERFTGRLDMEKVGMFGHSFGGATSTQMLMRDDRITAAINMDGILYGKQRVPEGGLKKPFLLMSADHSLQIAQTIPDRQQAEMIERMLTRYEHAADGGNYWLIINNMDHTGFSDFYLISPLIERMAGIHLQQAHRIINDYSLDFFNHYLKQQPLQLLNQVGEHPDYTLKKG